MFSVTHTTPKRAYAHLTKLKAEGDALSNQSEIHPFDTGRWAERMFSYLEKISAVPRTFTDVIQRNFPVLGSEDSKPLVEAPVEIQRRIIQKYQVTLSSAIEQFEAQYEAEIK